MAKARILVVDDDSEMLQMLAEYLESSNYEAFVTETPTKALEMARLEDVDIVLTDLRMDELDGLELTRQLTEELPDIPTVIMTAFGSIETAIEAVKAGASNFITKPFKMSSLKVILDKALSDKDLRDENQRLRRELTERYAFANLVGGSRPMRAVYDLIERVADTISNVLIVGESGTGKELVARAVHFGGPRKSKPFVAINCTSLPENLLESELFGHVRGAFTGAINAKKGLVEAAEGGTLFLDEIGDLDLPLQAKLLRLLEEREIRPVGSVATRPVDVRVIAATHRNLARAVELNEFREDLFFRLDVITIRVPPLRERREDIPLLVKHFLERHSQRLGRKLNELSTEAMGRLMERTWRGNVRELENVIERSVVLARGDSIEADDISGPDHEPLAAKGVEMFVQGRPTLDELEERYINLVLEEAGGDKSKAADVLGISTRTLYRREKR